MHKIEATIDDRGKMHGVVAPDYETYQKLLVAGAIVEWNLDERDGSLWRLSPDTARMRNIERLPDIVFERVLKRVEALNAEDPAADRAFRDGSGRRAEGDGERTTDAPEIPPGDKSVGPTWNTGVTPG